MKTCSKCGELKERSEFSKNAAAADGLQRCCKACHKLYNAELKTRNVAATAGLDIFKGEKTCSVCNETKSKSEFSKNAAATDGLFYCCKACVKVYGAERKARNIAANADLDIFKGEKQCSICNETKSKSEFQRWGRSADGLGTLCRECKRVKNAANRKRYREANVGKDPFDRTEKRCSSCKSILPRVRGNWTTDPSSRDGLNGRCLVCLSGKSGDLLDRIDKLWQKERSSKRTKDRVEWIDHGKGEWMCLAVKQQGRCALTGERLTVDNVSIDHIVPVSRGGTHEIENLRLVTLPVNRALNAGTDEDFIEMCRAAINIQMNLLCYGTKENPGAN